MGYQILTPHQADFLEQIQREPEITRWYYFTGGTVLSEFYLHHRVSEDIDLFSRSPVYQEAIDTMFSRVKLNLGINHIEKVQIAQLHTYKLKFTDGDVLKVDFNEYDFPQLEHGTTLGALSVDSYFDIAVNKLYTVLSRVKARDFVDLFIILQQGDISMEQLFSRIPDKFGIVIEELTILRQFSQASDLAEYPIMLVPFDRQAMVDFYLAEAKKLEKKIFK